MKKFVIGDIHGHYKELMQCIEKSQIDYNNDVLISLGDVCDRGRNTFECVEELLKFKHLIAIKGNHDNWFTEFLINGEHPVDWHQGGRETRLSYINHGMIENKIPASHYQFFISQIPYYLDNDILFVHGGINRHYKIDDETYNNPNVFMWDRDLFQSALSFKQFEENRFKNDFKEIFIGHTPTIMWDTTKPMFAANIINLDTGICYGGKLTIMNVETKEYYQSEKQ
jgi:serine/threonine protein phosphatase 1